jgi:hypothetical protein
MDTDFLQSLNASRPSAGSAKLPLSMQNTITAALGHRYAKYLKRLWISKSAFAVILDKSKQKSVIGSSK